MKAMMPPKAICPCHRAAAMGTLPIEHSTLMKASGRPTAAFSRLVQNPWPRRNRSLQRCIGTSTVKNPATQTRWPARCEAWSGRPSCRKRRRPSPPWTGSAPSRAGPCSSASPVPTSVACSSCAAPSAAARTRRRADSTSGLDSTRLPTTTSSTIMIGPPNELGGSELPAHQHDQQDAQLDDEVGGGEHEHQGGEEVGALLEQRLGHGGGRVGTRRRRRPEAGRPGHGGEPVVARYVEHNNRQGPDRTRRIRRPLSPVSDVGGRLVLIGVVSAHPRGTGSAE